MSQKASPTAIGAFVLGAAVLIIAGILAFGSGKLFKQMSIYSLYFTGNAKGLNVGAPIGFRGIQIGTVTDLKLIYDNSTDEVFISVVAEIDPDAFHEVQSIPGVDISANKDPLTHLIEELGLRAKLSTLSIVTGQLFIEFDFYPDTSVQLYGFKSPHTELPTLPSTMEEMQGAMHAVIRAVRQLPINDIVQKLHSTLEGVNKLVNSQDTQQVPEALHQAMVNLRNLTDKLNAEIEPLTNSLQQTSETAGAAFADVSTLLRDANSGKVIRLAESIELTANEARKLLAETRGVVSVVDIAAIETMVNELARAARSIRVFADYMERHPEALLRGKDVN